MKILLSNDDGYYSDGIQALIRELSIKHEIYVAAPLENNSAGSSALSTRKDIKVDNVEKNPSIENIQQLLETPDNDFKYVTDYANDVKSQIHGSDITFVVNRNINYTNICSFKCNFWCFWDRWRSCFSFIKWC